MAPEIPEVALHLSLFDLSLFDLSPFEFLMGENRLPFKGGRVLFQWAVPSLKQLPKKMHLSLRSRLPGMGATSWLSPRWKSRQHLRSGGAEGATRSTSS